ncbi:MAG: AMP-binding protein [Bryobacterales bacterium]|nr:AMP-binding protein [Bryobacterales bacterium]
MPAPARMQKRAVEGTVLETVRGLLRELGSREAAERASLKDSLERDLGLGSLERVELLVRLERALGTRLPEEGVRSARTPAGWVRIATAASARDPSEVGRWPIRQPARGAHAPPVEASTMTEVLLRQAERDPARVHVHLLDGDGGSDIGHAELADSAARIAAGLAESGLRRGETVAIMLPTCADFFASFLGVMLAGGIAVPVYPPMRASQIEGYIQRQRRILQNARVRFLITFDRVRTVASALGSHLPTLQEMLGAGELSERGRGLPAPEVRPSETCFIQYTSGSTGDPKGVMLTHTNVLANIRGIGHCVQVRPSDAVVTWLPLYHDMGLIGSWLFSLYHGLPITVLSPLDFLVRPERWLWALSDSKGSLCPAPNFAFELCVRKIGDDALQGVDLSPWRIAINAGEPVLAATLRRFSRRFAPWGFERRSFKPFYGLAESSVALTHTPYWRGPVVDTIDRAAYEKEGLAHPAETGEAAEVLEFVSNGRAMPDHEVRVVDDEGADLPERTRGRILFRGPSRTDGYFRNPAATAAVLGPGGWMDSGDLGYIADGELYVTGRLKDCIIKGGRNIIPQDVEMASWEADGVRKGCVAAFGTTDPDSGTEKLVVVAETRRSPAEYANLASAVTEAVASRVGIPPDDVVLVRPGRVPKTSSGKIQRSALRADYDSGRADASAAAPTWLQLARVWTRGTLRAGTSALAKRARHAGAMQVRAAVGFTAMAFGLAARLAPGPGAARFPVKAGARICGALAGHRTRGGIRHHSGSIVLVGRADRFDPLRVAAIASSKFVFADRTGFSELAPSQAFLVDPLVATASERSTRTDLQATIEAALSDGLAVISLSQSGPASGRTRFRFRYEAFAAAQNSGALLAPVGLKNSGNGHVRASVGAPMRVTGLPDSLAALRAKIRKELAGTQ